MYKNNTLLSHYFEEGEEKNGLMGGLQDCGSDITRLAGAINMTKIGSRKGILNVKGGERLPGFLLCVFLFTFFCELSGLLLLLLYFLQLLYFHLKLTRNDTIIILTDLQLVDMLQQEEYKGLCIVYILAIQTQHHRCPHNMRYAWHPFF